MNYFTFLRERGFQAAIFIWLLFSIETFLLTFESSSWLAGFVAVNLILAYFAVTYTEYRRRKKFLLHLAETADALSEKYLVSQVIEPERNQEEKILWDLLQDMGKSMCEHVNGYKQCFSEYKEYIELWIHEVKIPIAAAKMLVENNRSPVTESMDEELDKIANYTEQALYYARSSAVEKDYLIRRVKLQDAVNTVLADNRKALIAKRTVPILSGLDAEVCSDSKWLVFILNQVIANSLKYCGDSPLELRITARENKENITLSIADNGIGMKKEEVSKVFEKGFTGTNGRRGRKSTGIGLYLCKKLCARLGHGISFDAREGEGSTVTLIFPKASFVF